MAGKTLRKRASNPNEAKRYVKLLAVCRDPAVFKTLIQKSPDAVIKLICNAALNASRGEVHLTKAQKNLFAKHKSLFEKLSTRQISIKAKRKLINQRGNGLPLLPIILSTVLSSLGSLIFDRK